MIGDGSFSLIFYLIGYFTCIYEFFYTCFNDVGALCNLANNLYVAFTELFSFNITKDIDHILYVFGKLALVMCCNRNDMVHRKVAHNARLYLDFLCVSLPFYLISSF